MTDSEKKTAPEEECGRLKRRMAEIVCGGMSFSSETAKNAVIRLAAESEFPDETVKKLVENDPGLLKKEQPKPKPVFSAATVYGDGYDVY